MVKDSEDRKGMRLAWAVIAGFFLGLAFLIYIIATDL